MENETRMRLEQLEQHIEALEVIIEALIGSHPMPASLRAHWRHHFVGRKSMQGLAELTGKGRRPVYSAVLESLDRKVQNPVPLPPKEGG